MSEDEAYILDVSGLADGSDDDVSNSREQPAGRPWIGMQFECCGVYIRIYRNQAGTAYEGHCPRCGRPVHIRVGPGGTSHRMFRAT
ncbi:MAG TPA: hypothetical protein PKG54_19755 [Phycisphaerae bacterium]|jgi:hypothetical protein|nr:hypothetical protein [Phycisphaerae bacterium]HOB76753.1 hypothetical protein [Phycisphaerae bacterium]HOJ53656.1 hypothetical protein [Phycisphaerae bacterium]HOL26381.1 hypothetical protein [Phycisphaerae bacterium]HPP21111.1 hypothetical protein [Phycisphaerae bacterium]